LTRHGTTFCFNAGPLPRGMLGGYVIAGAGYRTLFTIGAGISVAGAVLMWAILKGQKTRLKPQMHTDAHR